jgi:hypothetical protein
MRELLPVTSTGIIARIQFITMTWRRLNVCQRICRDEELRFGYAQLKSVELDARGLDDFGVYDLKIMQDLKLPSFSDPTKLAWPVQKLPDWSSVVPVFRHPGAEWWKVKEEEEARGRRQLGLTHRGRGLAAADTRLRAGWPRRACKLTLRWSGRDVRKVP